MERPPGITSAVWQAWWQRAQASDYLVRGHQRDHEAFAALWIRPWPEILAALVAPVAPPEERTSLAELAKLLRQRKRLLMMVLAGLDYGDLASGQSLSGQYLSGPSLDHVTGALSDFAAMALKAGILACMQEQGFASDQGICALGMGKLGGRELNYSSDIDIILLYDSLALGTDLPHEERPAKVMRVVRQLIQFIEQVDSEGYIFRMDLRLRPDPLSTPPAVEIEAAIRYYESAGVAWERAAMIKARPVAGDTALAERFLASIKGFLWRRHLDYASIEDIKRIRQRALQPAPSDIEADGVNVKLVEGGIRDIEFFAQFQQLIWGGRDPGLRLRPTCLVLQALADHGYIPPETSESLQQAYVLYRRLEHAVQLLDDQQRHHLPNNAEEWSRLGRLSGWSPEQIKSAFVSTQATVYDICHPRTASAQQQEGSAPTPITQDSFELEYFQSRGFREAAAAKRTVERWLGGGYRVTASERSRRLLQQLLGSLLSAVAHTHQPDDALMRMDRFLEALPAGVQLFSLFAASPMLLRHCADIMGNAPRLAEWLARKPSLFEYLLHDDDDHHVKLEQLSASSIEVTLEQTLNECRRLAHESEFRTSVAFMSGKISLAQLQQATSDTAEAIIHHSLMRLRQSQPHLPQQGLAILALGKLGRGRLIPMSDLDMIFVYEPARASNATTNSTTNSTQAYVKLAQRLISALSVPTAEGKLYEVDLRLRPHGEAGSVICRMDMMRGYYAEEAWLWEHFALSQARILYADEEIAPAMAQWLHHEQTRRHDPRALQAAISDMRKRIATAFPSRSLWAIKHHPGGLMDASFVRQFLLLCLAHTHPALLHAPLSERYAMAVEHGFISLAQSQLLQRHMALLSPLEAGMRVTSGHVNPGAEKPFDPGTAPPGQIKLLCRLAEVDRLDDLQRRLRETYTETEALCQQLFPA